MKYMKLITILIILVCVWLICSSMNNQFIVDNKEHLTNTTNNIICNEAIQNMASVLNTGNGSVNNLTVSNLTATNIIKPSIDTPVINNGSLTGSTAITGNVVHNGKALINYPTDTVDDKFRYQPSLLIGPNMGEGISFIQNIGASGYNVLVEPNENVIMSQKNLNIVPWANTIGGIKIKSDGNVNIPKISGDVALSGVLTSTNKINHFGGLNGLVKRMPNARSVDNYDVGLFNGSNYAGFITTADGCIDKCREVPTASASTFNKADKKCWCKTIQALRDNGGYNDVEWETTYFN